MSIKKTPVLTTLAASLAGALTLTGLACAQQPNFRIGGIADGGTVILKRGNGWEKHVQSGNLAGSRVYFTGSEDLGGGLKANFHIERGFYINTGVQLPAFRRSIVGLESKDWGRLDFGRDYNPVFSVMVRTAPFGVRNEPVGNGTLNGATGFQGPGGAQANNAVFYTTPKVYGVTLKLMNSFSEATASPRSNGRRQGAHVYWDIANLPITAFSAYARQQTAVGGARHSTNDHQLLFGVQYKFGDGGFVTAYHQNGHNNSGVATYNANNGVPFARRWATSFLGFRLPIGQTPWTFAAAWQRYNDKTSANQDASKIGAAIFYSMSRRTTLYANYAQVNNRNGQRFTLVDAGRNSYNYTPAAGQTINPKGLAFGMRHTF